MNTASFPDALVVQALGGGGGGIERRVTGSAREIVFSDRETVG